MNQAVSRLEEPFKAADPFWTHSAGLGWHHPPDEVIEPLLVRCVARVMQAATAGEMEALRSENCMLRFVPGSRQRLYQVADACV